MVAWVKRCSVVQCYIHEAVTTDRRGEPNTLNTMLSLSQKLSYTFAPCTLPERHAVEQSAINAALSSGQSSQAYS